MINKRLVECGRNTGFTLIEFMVVAAIIAIIAGIGIPAFSHWLPNYRLKSAATDIFSNMQLAKMEAVKSNADFSIIFTPNPPKYTFSNGKTVNLSDYDDSGNIIWGADKDIYGAPLSDPIVYGTDDKLKFNARGTCESGTVYIRNQYGNAYAIGTLSSGVIRLRKWNTSSANWE